MFDIGYSELLLIAIVTLLVVGPKELPNLLRTVGKWTGKARSMARHFRSGFDTMIREAEIEEMNRQWAAQNQAIMAASDVTHLPEAERDSDLDELGDVPPALPAPDDAAAEEAPKPKRARAKKAATPADIPPAP
jgi:sec-independent protein translocase protein TatB